MPFFSHFGRVWFKLKDGKSIVVNDVTKFVTIRSRFTEDPRLHMVYDIQDGDRPELLSHRLYDTVDHAWTVLLLNDIDNIEDKWPRNEDQLEQYIDTKYPFNNKDDVHHYETIEGLVTDLTAVKAKLGVTLDADAIAIADLLPVSIYDYELNLNDAKRRIKLVDPDNINSLIRELEEAFNG